MKEDKNILDQLKKRHKPHVPEGFFETYSDELMAKIIEHESGIDDLKKTTPPDVPNNFFESFAENILLKTGDDQLAKRTRPVKVINLRIVGIIGAAAACLLVAFLINHSNNDQTLAENETIHSDKTTETLLEDELLVYVDEADIINYIVEEDIDFSEDEALEMTNGDETDQKSDKQLNDLNKEDILYYLEDDLNGIYLEDIEL